MKRHIQVIFEALLTIFIIVDILVLALMVAGLTLGIMHRTIYNIGNYDLIIAILILIDFLTFRFRDKTKENDKKFIENNWIYIAAIIPIPFICFNIFHLFDYAYIIGLVVILRFYALYKVLRITGKEITQISFKNKIRLCYRCTFISTCNWFFPTFSWLNMVLILKFLIMKLQCGMQ